MKRNRADFYSILNVQPGDSQETIKARYLKLMVTMKMHPDLGGSHEMAARINEAYQALSNEAKDSSASRTQALQQLRHESPASLDSEHRFGSFARMVSVYAPVPASTYAPKVVNRPVRLNCPLCRAEQLQSIGPESRCDRCRSPLDPPPTLGSNPSEPFGRRTGSRTDKSNLGTVYPVGQPHGMSVKMRDLSLSGMSFYSEVPLAIGQSFRFRDPTLEAVASVVLCKKRGESYSVHAKLLTVSFHNKSGVFVSAEA